jgi:aspartate/tyrosine/aromatic aminotransferase
MIMPSQSMGLYSDSPTIVSVVASTVNDKERIQSQLKSMARAMHAHPPPWGAYVAATVLGDSVVHNAWCVSTSAGGFFPLGTDELGYARLLEVKAMSERLRSIREKLYDQLTNKLKTPGNWTHFRKSQGMFR